MSEYDSRRTNPYNCSTTKLKTKNSSNKPQNQTNTTKKTILRIITKSQICLTFILEHEAISNASK